MKNSKSLNITPDIGMYLMRGENSKKLLVLSMNGSFIQLNFDQVKNLLKHLGRHLLWLKDK